MGHLFAMPKLTPLPFALTASPFSVREAQRFGVSIDRLRSADLDRPFHGVRSTGVDLTILENRCIAFATRMRGTAMFSHVTAAALWAMPLPLGSADGPLHVTAVLPQRAPRTAGVTGHHRASLEMTLLRNLPVSSAPEVWADVAETLALHDLVAVGEFIVTEDQLRNRPALATLDELRAVTELRNGSAGSLTRRRALQLIEVGPLSRPESLVRLLLVGAGLPHPLINPEIRDKTGAFVAKPDLAWREWKVALEYEGDHHRAVTRFRKDIARIERLVDQGWLVVKVSADDLFDEPRALVERVVRRLVSRGWTPGRIHIPQSGLYRR